MSSPEPPPLRAVGSERLDACVSLLETPELMDECLGSIPSGWVTADVLSRWLCESSLGVNAIGTGLSSLLVRMPPQRFLGLIDDIQVGCDRFRETPIWIKVLDGALQYHPEWYAQVADRVLPETVFGARSEGPVQAAEAFVTDERIRLLLEDGARGYFGGSPEQMHRAGLIVIVNPRPGEDRTAFIGSLLDSAMTTSEGQMGCLIAQFLAAGQDPNDPAQAASLLLRCLQDDRFSTDASLQLTRYFDDGDSRGLDPRQWLVIMRMARSIAAAAGASDE